MIIIIFYDLWSLALARGKRAKPDEVFHDGKEGMTLGAEAGGALGTALGGPIGAVVGTGIGAVVGLVGGIICAFLCGKM